MARVGRLAGSLLVQSQGQFWLVGDLKEPCDFAAAGFERPPVLPGRETRFVMLTPLRPVFWSGPTVAVDVEGEALASLLYERLVIERNGSVSDRLWRLVVGGDERGETDGRWLGLLPDCVWRVVRESVLKCS